MSLFSILQASGTDKPVVAECHVNYWALPGLLADRFLVDVGLSLKNAGAAPLSAIEVALPCGTIDGGVEDLADRLTEEKTLALIFGQQVKLSSGTIDYGKGVLAIMPISAPESTLSKSWRTRSFSVWNLKLARPLPPAQSCYLRVRFEVDSLGRAWTWKRSLLSKTGARFDFRVSDVREAIGISGVAAIQSRMLPIEELYAFVMVPGWLEPVLISPTPKYVRVLESSAWATYIRRGYFGSSRQQLIFYWQKSSVSAQSGFQGFLDLRNAAPVAPLSSQLRGAIIVIAALWLLSLAAPGEILADKITWIVGLWREALAATTVGGVLKLLGYWPKYRDTVISRIRVIERAILRARVS